MPSQTLTIDVLVHAYERDCPERPWSGSLVGPEEVTGDDMVAAMDAVAVDGAILVSPFSMYRYDASYALEVYAKHPGRFGLVKPFDPGAETVADEVAEWAEKPGAIGARLMLAAGLFEADCHGGCETLAQTSTSGRDHNAVWVLPSHAGHDQAMCGIRIS